MAPDNTTLMRFHTHSAPSYKTAGRLHDQQSSAIAEASRNGHETAKVLGLANRSMQPSLKREKWKWDAGSQWEHFKEMPSRRKVCRFGPISVPDRFYSLLSWKPGVNRTTSVFLIDFYPFWTHTVQAEREIQPVIARITARANEKGHEWQITRVESGY